MASLAAQAGAAVKIERDPKGEDAKGGGQPQNMRGGGARRRGGRGGPGGGGPHRGFFGGGGGPGRGGGGERRPYDGGYDGGPMNKRPKMGMMTPEQRVMEKIRGLVGPTADMPPKKFEVKKFAANTRLYIGNISNEVTESEIKELFVPFGEIDEVFLNREKNFAFLKLDWRTNAERARAELDQMQVKNRPIKVRFAPANVRIKVKNLAPSVSNELLEMAFSVFGDVERAIVFVDDKGKSLGEGFVEFSRKNCALAAHKFCQEKCYFLTSELRPVITEIGEMYEVDEGLLEGNLNKREYGKDRELVYYKSREMGPRVAEDGTFDHEYGEKLKALVREFSDKEKELKNELTMAVEKLQTQMEMARYDHETELLRRQLRQRELDQERQKMQWEQRMGFGGFNQNGMGQMGGPGPVSMNQGQSIEAAMNQVEDTNGGGGDNGSGALGQPLAPPPMPPQGLMQNLLNMDEEMNSAEPTWEIGPFGFNQMGGNFGQPPAIRQNDQRDGRFMGRGGMGGPRGLPPRGNRGFRGGRGGVARR